MKYLDYPELEALSRALTFESAECKVFTRLEAYSCKAVNKEKRLFKALESAYHQTQSTSPPDYLEEILASPFGRLDQPGARKTLFLLIALLNGAFPDHDFSQVNPADFRKEPNAGSVLHSLSSTLFNLRENNGGLRAYSNFFGSFDQHVQGYMQSSTSLPNARDSTRPFTGFGGATHAGLNSLLDDIMDVGDCEVFTFHPDADSDPHACEEPEQEGLDYDDGDYWSDDGDVSMQSVNIATPRRDSGDLEDTPMFDEDLEGGFPASGKNHRTWGGGPPTDESAGLHTPKNPTSAAGHGSELTSRPYRDAWSGRESSSMSSDDSFPMDDDDEDDGFGGLLWSTYAFFYNRRLKRILFVTVWSRTNTGGGSWTSPLTTFEPMLSIPSSFKLPSSVTSPRVAPESKPQRAASGSKRGGRGSSSSSTTRNKSPSKVSPAKVAIEKTARGRSSGARSKGGAAPAGSSASVLRSRRAASGSPAPSALSPFPHASPRSVAKQDGGGAGGVKGSSLRPTGGVAAGSSSRVTPLLSTSDTSDRVSLDAAALSISAPNVATAKRNAGDGDGPQAPTNEAEKSSISKRTRRQVAAQ